MIQGGRKMRTSLIFLTVGALTFSLCISAEAKGPGTSAANFLKIGVGARATAMGDAFTGLANDGTCLYWNPAGLTQLEKRECLVYVDPTHMVNKFYTSTPPNFIGYIAVLKLMQHFPRVKLM